MNELCHLWRSERYEACGDDASGGVLFSGEKYPKAAGDTGAEGPFQGQTPPFPRTPFRDASGGGAIQLPSELESSCLPVRLVRAVPLLPVQRSPPKLVSSFNSMTFLNAARSLCAVFQSAPERVCRISTFKKAKKNG